jgi:protein-S-isoprenylcysteine O-methyltransferase Ste14
VTAHLVVVFVEDPGLARRFGRVYDRYRDAVPRWMPRPPARDDA